MSQRLRKRYGCPVELAADVLGGKWKTVILARTKDGPLSYGHLRRLIPGLSDKILSQKLRELTELGVLEQVADGRLGDRKLYALTRRCRGLVPALEALYLTGEALAEGLGVGFADAGRA